MPACCLGANSRKFNYDSSQKDFKPDVLGERYGRLIRDGCLLPFSQVFLSFVNIVETKLERAGVLENIAADTAGHDKP